MSDGQQRLAESVFTSIKAQLVVDLFVVPAIEDYVVARWSYINGLDRQFLWSSLQCIEKLLKAIMIAHEIDTRRYGHHVGKMATDFRLSVSSDFLEREFKNFQQREPFGAKNPVDFILNLEKLGAPKTRYRLLKTVVNFNDIDRLDETFSRLTKFEEPMGLLGTKLPPASFYEHTTYSDAVREALTQGNMSFDVSNKKQLNQTFRMKQSPADYPEDPLSFRSQAMTWLRGLAQV